MERMHGNITERNITSGVTAKWKPTTEQRTILEYIYRTGLGTPKAEEIERITVDLKKYGEIEGKNVFYWFQNFSARERHQRKNFTAKERQKPKRASELLHFKSGGASRDTVLSIAKLRRSTSPSEIVDLADGERKVVVQEHLGICGRESQTNPTLELFPLRPDRGGLER